MGVPVRIGPPDTTGTWRRGAAAGCGQLFGLLMGSTRLRSRFALDGAIHRGPRDFEHSARSLMV